MKVVPVPILDDNYAYLLIDERDSTTAVVDPAEPEKVLAAATKEGVQISKVLTTHKHSDHAGGNTTLKHLVPHLEVVGGSEERVQACTTGVSDGECFAVGSISVTCLHTPGHTMGHICYYVTDGDERAVFTGDMLFIGGAGRFFEGSATDVFPSLYEKLGKLPPDTLVYCGHEYTLANYRFALSIEPDNKELKRANQLATGQASYEGLADCPDHDIKGIFHKPFHARGPGLSAGPDRIRTWSDSSTTLATDSRHEKQFPRLSCM
ncbi:unnamed protein product [Choristocarpus tenellus]